MEHVTAFEAKRKAHYDHKTHARLALHPEEEDEHEVERKRSVRFGGVASTTSVRFEGVCREGNNSGYENSNGQPM